MKFCDRRIQNPAWPCITLALFEVAQKEVNGNCDKDDADYASDDPTSYGTDRSRLLAS